MAAYGGLVTVVSGKITGSLSNFTAVLTQDNFPAAAINGGVNSILNGGGNLRCYTDSSKSAQIPIEVVEFVTGAVPNCIVFVLSPTLQSGDTVYIEADTVATAQPVVSDIYGRNSTYKDSLRYRLSVGGASTEADVTGNDDLDVFGTSVQSTEIAGFGDGSSQLNNLTVYANAADPTKNISYFGVRFWVNSNDAASSGVIGSYTNNSNMTFLVFLDVGDNKLVARINAGGINYEVRSTSVIAGVNTSFFCSVLYTGSTLLLMVNGAVEASIAASGAIFNASAPFNIGTWNNTTTFRLDSKLQEVSVSVDTSVDVNFIAAEYENQVNPSAFWVTGAWEEQGSGGITVTGATGNYNYTGVAGSIDLTGEVVVTGSTAKYNYAGVQGSVLLDAEIIVTGQTANYNYTGIDGSVELTGLITVTGKTADYDYTGLTADVTLQGSIVITGSTANYDYNALNGTIILQGPITINPKNIVRVNRKSNTIRVKRSSNTIIVR